MCLTVLGAKNEGVKKGQGELHYEGFHDLRSCGKAGMFGMREEVWTVNGNIQINDLEERNHAAGEEQRG